MKPTAMKPRRNTVELLKSMGKQHLLALTIILSACCQACSTTTSSSSSSAAAELKTFESDGCTCVPDGPRSDPDKWHPFCEEHDLAYWKGGTRRDRLNADRKLKAAIKESGHPCISEIYFIGTRFGGTPYLPTPWRWGFGKKYPSGYEKPVPKE